MIYIENFSTDAHFNLALEYYLISEKKLDDDLVFLFWRTAPTLMVGKYQNTLEEINEKYVREHGLDVVRRRSGGGTIYTDLGGWQFSFIARNAKADIRFEDFIKPVVRAIREMGVDADFNGRNDLVIGGKKFSGNAQYMHGGYTVHHGSLLYCTDLEELVRSTTVDSYKIISKGIKSVRERVTNIADHLKDPVSSEEFGASMIKSLTADGAATYRLTDEDIAATERIASEQSRTWQAVYGASPSFNIERTGRFEGGKVTAKLDIRKGKIADIRFYGDFFYSGDIDLLRGALIDSDYKRAQIEQTLAGIPQGQAFYKITWNELLNLLID